MLLGNGLALYNSGLKLTLNSLNFSGVFKFERSIQVDAIKTILMSYGNQLKESNKLRQNVDII
jgi:hypothetical protein